MLRDEAALHVSSRSQQYISEFEQARLLTLARKVA